MDAIVHKTDACIHKQKPIEALTTHTDEVHRMHKALRDYIPHHSLFIHEHLCKRNHQAVMPRPHTCRTPATESFKTPRHSALRKSPKSSAQFPLVPCKHWHCTFRSSYRTAEWKVVYSRNTWHLVSMVSLRGYLYTLQEIT